MSTDDRKYKLPLLIGAAIVGFLGTILGTFGASYHSGIYSDIFLKNETINVLLSSSAIFIICKQYIQLDENSSLSKVILTVSSTSLGIYVVHAMILQILHITLDEMILGWNSALYLVVFYSITLVGSFLVSFAFKQIPYIKKFF